ncbi:MAG TPA: AMP-binding protein [Myxococcales bacterium]|nr:AMP-binding protein [Myxococcales bacterium]
MTFAELAERVRARTEELRGREAPFAFVATPELDVFVSLYACLELRLPFVPIHPKLPVAERTRRLAEGGAFCPVGREGEEAALACVYTSGTAGLARAVELSRRAFTAAAAASAARLGWRDDDRWLLALPVAHVGGLSILIRCLLARRPVVVATGASFAPDEILELLSRDGVSLCSLVPAQLERLLDAAPEASPPGKLRVVLLGGAGAKPALLERARAFGWPVLATYGLTETCAQVATQRPGTHAGGVGEPLEGVGVRVVDGVVEVRTPALMTAFHPGGVAPALTSDGWFRTGDLGRIDGAGALWVTGRGDEVIVTGGEKVAPAEVEQVLEGCAGVASACVFGVEDPVWGQLVAAAIVTAPPAPDVRELARELGAKLATFQRPRRLAVLDTLPLNAAGKIDRKAVAREAAGKLVPLLPD